jgi:hypothetical protein
VDAEPVGERRVDLEGLAGLLRLLLFRLVLDRPHVVEAVGELDEDDADVLRHRDDHLPVVLGLRLFAALEGDPRQLRHSFDELGDLGTELGPDLLEVGAGVLDDVVEKRRRDRLLVEVELGADPRDAEGVVDELLARAPHLALVRALGDGEGVAQKILVDVRVVALDLGDQLVDEVLVMPFRVEDAHSLSVLAPSRDPFLAPAGGARGAAKTGSPCEASGAGSDNGMRAAWRSSCATPSCRHARASAELPTAASHEDHAASSSTGSWCARSARKVSDSSSWRRLIGPPARTPSSPSSAKTRRASGVQASEPACHRDPRYRRSSS